MKKADNVGSNPARGIKLFSNRVVEKMRFWFALVAVMLIFAGCVMPTGDIENSLESAEHTNVQPDEISGVDNLKSVEKGDTVKVEYIGSFPDGEVFDKSEGRGPLEFTAGAGQMIKGFDAAVIGMKVGEEKTVTIPPEDAYGVGGGHPLAGKTLEFWIKVVEIN